MQTSRLREVRERYFRGVEESSGDCEERKGKGREWKGAAEELAVPMCRCIDSFRE